MTKKLFVLLSNNGDGSSSAHYTFNEEWLKKQQDEYATGGPGIDYECGLGIDGDGFHYDTLTVPDECTLQSLGIHYDCAE
jgi:hypothetical protein